jgi:hypothetical protein
MSGSWGGPEGDAQAQPFDLRLISDMPIYPSMSVIGIRRREGEIAEHC